MSLVMETRSLRILEHAGPDWEVRAEARPGGLLLVQSYHLGTLPVEQRIMGSRDLARQVQCNRRVFEDRAGRLSNWLREMAAAEGCRKISLIASQEDVPAFLAAGLRVEAMVERTPGSSGTCCWLADFLTGSDGEVLPDVHGEAAGVAVHIREDLGHAEAWLDTWQGGAAEAEGELERLRRNLEGKGLATLVCLVDPGQGLCEPLRRLGFHCRGRLSAHRGAGARDLLLWAASF